MRQEPLLAQEMQQCNGIRTIDRVKMCFVNTCNRGVGIYLVCRHGAHKHDWHCTKQLFGFALFEVPGLLIPACAFQPQPIEAAVAKSSGNL